MEPRLANILERLGQADRNLRDQGRDPESFLLIHTGGMESAILHAAWDPSWATPTAEDIDDLGELGHVRVEPSTDKKRSFALRPKGRQQAAVLADKRVPPSGGRAPGLDRVLDWLLEQERDEPDSLEAPGRLIPAAVASGFIDDTAREPLAGRVLDLHAQQFLSGHVPEVMKATNEQRLGLAQDLSLTMKAHDHAQGRDLNAGNTVNFNGSVIAGQIAAGDITNYVSFAALLDQAEVEITALEEIEDEARAEALGLIEVLRGKAAAASGELLTGAGGGLLATVFARLLGLQAAG
jgi:hypothetical protein